MDEVRFKVMFNLNNNKYRSIYHERAIVATRPSHDSGLWCRFGALSSLARSLSLASGDCFCERPRNRGKLLLVKVIMPTRAIRDARCSDPNWSLWHSSSNQSSLWFLVAGGLQSTTSGNESIDTVRFEARAHRVDRYDVRQAISKTVT